MGTVLQGTRVQPTRRLALAGLALGGLIALVVLLLTSGSGPPSPASGAAALVPADALAYVHLSTDLRRPEVRQAQALARRFPDDRLLAAAVTSRLSTLLGAGVSLDYARQIRPWLGREAAFAVLNTPGATANSLIVLDVRHAGPLFDTGAARAGTYRGIQLYRGQNGTQLAFVSHYLVVGQDASVRAAIDVAQGRRPSLAGASAYRAAAAGEPPARVLDAYLSAAGVQRLLAPRGGVAGAFAALLSQPGLRGATIALSPASGGANLRVHSALSGPSQTPPSFAPSLDGSTPAGSPLMLDVGDLTRAAPAILGASAQLGLARNLGPLLRRLGPALTAEGVNVRSVVSLFAGESALSVVPNGGVAGLTLVARAPRERSARAALAALEAPLAQLFTPAGSSTGVVPEWTDQQVGGVTVRQFALAPGLQLDYAVFNKLVVVSTSVRGIAAIAGGGRSLAGQGTYRHALANRPSRVRSLLFLDFSQLLSLGEQTRLVRSSRLSRLRPDLERIRAVGASSTGGEADTTAELFLEIS